MEYESAGPPGGVPLRVGNYQPENVVEEGNMTSQSSSSSIKDSPVYIHGVRFWLISIAYVRARLFHVGLRNLHFPTTA